MYLSYEDLFRQPGFSELSEEAKTCIRTIDDNPGIDPQMLFCDDCGTFCGEDYCFAKKGGHVYCPTHAPKAKTSTESIRWGGGIIENREARNWLMALGKLPYTFAEAALLHLIRQYGENRNDISVQEKTDEEDKWVCLLQKLEDGLFLEAVIIPDKESGQVLTDFQLTDSKSWYVSLWYTEHYFPEAFPYDSAEAVLGEIRREISIIASTISNTIHTFRMLKIQQTENPKKKEEII